MRGLCDTRTLKETAHFDAGRFIADLRSKYLQLRFSCPLMDMLDHMKVVDPSTPAELTDYIRNYVYLNWLVSADGDPRMQFQEKYNFRAWVDFLKESNLPVFPWEYSVYTKMEDALERIGIRFNGTFADFMRAKKTRSRNGKVTWAAVLTIANVEL